MILHHPLLMTLLMMSVDEEEDTTDDSTSSIVGVEFSSFVNNQEDSYSPPSNFKNTNDNHNLLLTLQVLSLLLHIILLKRKTL